MKETLEIDYSINIRTRNKIQRLLHKIIMFLESFTYYLNLILWLKGSTLELVYSHNESGYLSLPVDFLATCKLSPVDI